MLGPLHRSSSPSYLPTWQVVEEARQARETLVDTLSTFDDKVMERFLEHDSSLEGVPADMIAQVHPLARTTTSQKCAAVPRRARMYGS